MNRLDYFVYGNLKLGSLHFACGIVFYLLPFRIRHAGVRTVPSHSHCLFQPLDRLQWMIYKNSCCMECFEYFDDAVRLEIHFQEVE